jgi:hypothetical protein
MRRLGCLLGARDTAGQERFRSVTSWPCFCLSPGFAFSDTRSASLQVGDTKLLPWCSGRAPRLRHLQVGVCGVRLSAESVRLPADPPRTSCDCDTLSAARATTLLPTGLRTRAPWPPQTLSLCWSATRKT